MTSGKTRVAGIIGGPQQVGESLSPVIHNAAFEALALDWIYVPFPVQRDPAGAIAGLAAAGLDGLNVTMPHKIAASEAMSHLVGDAAIVGAINTVEFSKGELIGHNTDGRGLIEFLKRDAGIDIGGKKILVLGAGGAARAVVSAAAASGASEIVVAARDPSRAGALSELAANVSFDVLRLGPSRINGAFAEVVINATPLGQEGEMPPLEIESLGEAVVVDLVYHPPSTPLIEACRKRGITAHNGLGMLVHQAALAFEIWTGLQPPLEVMSAAALSAPGPRPGTGGR